MAGEGELLTTSGLVAVITAVGVIIGTITKYLSEKRKETQDNDERTIARLEARVAYLEDQNQQLSQKIIEQANEIGFLRGQNHHEAS